MPEISDDEVKLLESLEAEGLLSKGVARRVRTAMRIGHVAGAVRVRIATIIALMVLTCFLLAGADAADAIEWLETLCQGLAITSVLVAFGTLISIGG